MTSPRTDSASRARVWWTPRELPMLKSLYHIRLSDSSKENLFCIAVSKFKQLVSPFNTTRVNKSPY